MIDALYTRAAKLIHKTKGAGSIAEILNIADGSQLVTYTKGSY